MNANQEKLNDLRTQRRSLESKIALANEERSLAHQAVAVAVADDHRTPSNWHKDSGRLDKELEALTLGLTGIDGKIQAHRKAANLETAKLSSRREPLSHSILALKEQRMILVHNCLLTLRSGAATPADFTKQLDAMDAEIRAKAGDLVALDVAIANVTVA